MRKLAFPLSLALVAMSLWAAPGLAAGAGVAVEGRAAAGRNTSTPELNEVQRDRAAAAVGQADLVAVVRVTEVVGPKKDDADGEKDDNGDAGAIDQPRAAILRMGGAGGGTEEKLYTAEIVEVIKGDAGAKVVKIKANTLMQGQREYVLVSEERELRDANGGVMKFSSQHTEPCPLAKDRKALVFLKLAEEKKDEAGKAAERTYKMLPPLVDGAPEEAVAAAKDALRKIEEWKNPPALPEAERAAVEKLIAQLGADDFAAREAATKALIEKGAAVRGLVEAATKSQDPEISQRAAQVLEAIKPASPDQANPPSAIGVGGGGIILQNGNGVIRMEMKQGGE